MAKEYLKVNLYRYWKTDTGIVGLVDVPDIVPLFSIELPWKNNKKKVSCIPAANYVCKRRKSIKNQGWGEAFEVLDVPGRSNIIFGHIGNSPADLEGCVAIGCYYPRADYVSNSASAVDTWMKRMTDISMFKLSIYERGETIAEQ